MKKSLYILFILLITAAVLPAADLLFNLTLEEGAFYTAETIHFVNNISSDIAYIYSIQENNSLIGFYQIKFSGPGLGNSAEAKFSEKNQNHYFMLKDLWEINKKLTLKPTVSFMKGFSKYGKNEEWGEGLYDYNRWEGGADADILPQLSLPLSLGIKYQSYKYPNYTDLLTLYLTDFTKEEPLEDYDNIAFSFDLKQSTLIKPLILSFSYYLNLSDYSHKKVLNDDGSYKSETQAVKNHLLVLLPQYQLNKSLLLSLHSSIEINDSNQNYIFGFNPLDIRYFENYYDYTTVNIKPYITWFSSETHSFTFLISYINKAFADRLAQDNDGAYLKSKISVDTMAAGLLYTAKLSKYFTLSPAYQYIYSTSNNKYQRATTYNYDAHLITLKLNYEY